MIKFFRNIRQNLIMENKTVSSVEASAKAGKYLKYAIGEIVLVVIGILMALQINSYNQSLVDKKNEMGYLKGIYDDLNTQIEDFEETMRLNEYYISTTNKILNDYIKNDRFKANDSLLSNINKIISVAAPVEINTSFTELLNSGDLGIIRNDTLRKNIVRFYQELEQMVRTSMVNIENIYQSHIYPILYNRTLLVTPGNYSKLEGNLNSLYKKRTYSERSKALAFKKIEDEDSEVVFINALNSKLVIESLQFKRTETIISKAQKLKKEIEEEALEQHHVILKKLIDHD